MEQSTTKKPFCNFCQIYTFSQKEMDNHLLGRKHVKSHQRWKSFGNLEIMKLVGDRILKVVENGHKCTLCATGIMTNELMVWGHLRGRKHARRSEAHEKNKIAEENRSSSPGINLERRGTEENGPCPSTSCQTISTWDEDFLDIYCRWRSENLTTQHN